MGESRDNLAGTSKKKKKKAEGTKGHKNQSRKKEKFTIEGDIKKTHPIPKPPPHWKSTLVRKQWGGVQTAN